MPTTSTTILLILVTLLLCKWEQILMLIMFLPVRILQEKKKRSLTTHLAFGEEIYQVKHKETRKKIVQGIKEKIYIYLDGYCKYLLYKTAYIPSMRCRIFIYKHIFCTQIDEKAVIYYGTILRATENIAIGTGSIIGDFNMIDGRYGVTIGENVNLSTGVWIWTAQHDYNSPTFACTGKCGKVIIGDRTWVGPRTIILPSVTIGVGAVIAGGSVVTKDVPPYTVVAGIPAIKIADRNKKLTYHFDGGHTPFF